MGSHVMQVFYTDWCQYLSDLTDGASRLSLLIVTILYLFKFYFLLFGFYYTNDKKC